MHRQVQAQAHRGQPDVRHVQCPPELDAVTEEKQYRWREDPKHLQFVGELYKPQVKEGRWFYIFISNLVDRGV